MNVVPELTKTVPPLFHISFMPLGYWGYLFSVSKKASGLWKFCSKSFKEKSIIAGKYDKRLLKRLRMRFVLYSSLIWITAKALQTRKCGNYSDALPLKIARRDSVSNLTSFGLQIW